jgi:hypothetical protein
MPDESSERRSPSAKEKVFSTATAPDEVMKTEADFSRDKRKGRRDEDGQQRDHAQNTRRASTTGEEKGDKRKRPLSGQDLAGSPSPIFVVCDTRANISYWRTERRSEIGSRVAERSSKDGGRFRLSGGLGNVKYSIFTQRARRLRKRD